MVKATMFGANAFLRGHIDKAVSLLRSCPTIRLSLFNNTEHKTQHHQQPWKVDGKPKAAQGQGVPTDTFS